MCSSVAPSAAESVPGSSRTLCTSPGGDDKFWVPHTIQRQTSIGHSEVDTSPGW